MSEEISEEAKEFLDDIESACTQVELLYPLISLIRSAGYADPDNGSVEALIGAAKLIELRSMELLTKSEQAGLLAIMVKKGEK